jgi:Ca2+-binding RTX toxin-like protein
MRTGETIEAPRHRRRWAYVATLAALLVLGLASVAAADVIIGTNGDDVDPNNLTGTTGDDLIFALAGDDDVFADQVPAGNDTIFGGPGHDGIATGTGNDTVYGGSGHDTIFGPNLLIGPNGADQFFGDSGEDFLKSADAAQVSNLYGGPNDDFLLSGTGVGTTFIPGDGGGGDTLNGGSGSDVCYGDATDTFVSCESITLP